MPHAVAVFPRKTAIVQKQTDIACLPASLCICFKVCDSSLEDCTFTERRLSDACRCRLNLHGVDTGLVSDNWNCFNTSLQNFIVTCARCHLKDPAPPYISRTNSILRCCSIQNNCRARHVGSHEEETPWILRGQKLIFVSYTQSIFFQKLIPFFHVETHKVSTSIRGGSHFNTQAMSWRGSFLTFTVHGPWRGLKLVRIEYSTFCWHPEIEISSSSRRTGLGRFANLKVTVKWAHGMEFPLE